MSTSRGIHIERERKWNIYATQTTSQRALYKMRKHIMAAIGRHRQSDRDSAQEYHL